MDLVLKVNLISRIPLIEEMKNDNGYNISL